MAYRHAFLAIALMSLNGEDVANELGTISYRSSANRLQKIPPNASTSAIYGDRSRPVSHRYR